MNPLYDTHAHLNDRMFDSDRDEVIKKIRSSNVGLVNNIAYDIESSRTAIALAEKYDFIYATVGVHPSDVLSMTGQDIDTLRELSKHQNGVVLLPC